MAKRLDNDGRSSSKARTSSKAIGKSPTPTREIVDSDDWLHTGDVGEWKDGNLRLIDRARDFIVIAGGKTISPSSIENTLRASPYISEAIVFGQAANISPR